MPLIIDREAWLEQLCAETPGEVAHLGCADSPYTEELLAAGLLLHAHLVRVARVTGFDVDDRALELLRQRMPGERFVQADVTAGVPEEERSRYDLVVAPGDRQALAEAIDRLLADEQLRVRLGAAGREAVSGYTYEAMLAAFDRALTSAMRPSPTGP